MMGMGFRYGEHAPGLLRCARICTRKVSCTRAPVQQVENCWTLGYMISKHSLFTDDPQNVSTGISHGNRAKLFAPGVIHYQQATSDFLLTSCWVQFWGYPPRLKDLTKDTKGFLLILDSEGILLKMMIECAKCANEGEAGYWKAHTQLCRILDLFNHLVPDGGNNYSYHILREGEAEPKTSLVQQVRCYLDQHYREKITLEMLAKHAGVSISSLAHQYRQETGKAVMEDLMRLRLNQSIALLSDGLPLKNIAESTGFCNQFYYSLQFKKHFGCSPVQWISKHGKVNS